MILSCVFAAFSSTKHHTSSFIQKQERKHLGTQRTWDCPTQIVAGILNEWKGTFWTDHLTLHIQSASQAHSKRLTIDFTVVPPSPKASTEPPLPLHRCVYFYVVCLCLHLACVRAWMFVQVCALICLCVVRNWVLIKPRVLCTSTPSCIYDLSTLIHSPAHSTWQWSQWSHTIGIDLQSGCSANQLLIGLGQPQLNPSIRSEARTLTSSLHLTARAPWAEYEPADACSSPGQPAHEALAAATAACAGCTCCCCACLPCG